MSSEKEWEGVMLNRRKKLAVLAALSLLIAAAFTQQASAAGQAELYPAKQAEDDLGCMTEFTGGVRAKEAAQMPAPETVAQQKLTYNSVTLGWTSVKDAAGYQVEYSVDGANYTVAGKTEAGTLSYECKGLVTGVQYQFRVCALDQSGSTGGYASLTVLPVLKKTKFTYADVTQEQSIRLEWSKVSGAESYELYRKEAQQEEYELLTVTAESSYTDKAVVSGGIYSYQVRAVCEVNGTAVRADFSKEAKVAFSSTASSSASSQAHIEIVSLEPVSYQSVRITWSQDAAASGYYIYRSVKENGTYRKIKTISKRTILTYTDAKLVPGKKFYYKIAAYTKGASGAVTVGEQSQAMSVQTQAQAPELVAIHPNLTNRSVSLEWKKADGASGYRIYRSAYQDRGFKKIKDLSSGTFVGYEDRSVTPGGTYYYRMKSIYTNGSYKGLSAASVSMEGNVAPSSPIGLTVAQTEEETLKVSWNLSIGAQSYNVYRTDDLRDDFTCIAQGLTDTEYADSGVADGETYYYRIAAVGAAGEGLLCHAVSCRVGGISLNTRTLKLCVGVTKPLKVSTYLEGDAEWSSADTDIATVDDEGNVTGVAYGTVKVTATVDGQSASAAVSVTPGSKNGIDVSRWQEDVDWNRVKESGVEFAFLRISNHNLADYTFETKYQNAFSVGMPMGVYCYSRATTVEEAQEEARIVLEILGGRKLDYPVALDLEDAVHKAKTMKKETLHQMIHAFKQVIEDAGYRFVLYSYVTFLNTYLDRTKLDGIDLWVARYRNVSLGTGYNGTGNVKYWQYNSGQYSGSNAQVDGITKDTGELVSVDVNVEYE